MAAGKSSLIRDERFARLHTDPRFQRVPKKERKVVVDDRVSAMFKDDAFQDEAVVSDKYGRQQQQGKKKKGNERLQRIYGLDDEATASASASSTTVAAAAKPDKKPKKGVGGSGSGAQLMKKQEHEQQRTKQPQQKPRKSRLRHPRPNPWTMKRAITIRTTTTRRPAWARWTAST